MRKFLIALSLLGFGGAGLAASSDPAAADRRHWGKRSAGVVFYSGPIVGYRSGHYGVSYGYSPYAYRYAYAGYPSYGYRHSYASYPSYRSYAYRPVVYGYRSRSWCW